ncbi:amino acid oxidase [Rothia nasimurium]|uniref:amino acid oxidase n=1 Tax=Rothia nasimurium TaxID=85336 RepID=UPI001D15F8C5|nr:amino acid oxidase [Rothia nasimurium]
MGYFGGNDITGQPKTQAEYFLATTPPESDFNWNDATSSPYATPYVNGEGSFTPVTNGATATAGTYGSLSGFWFSVPTNNTLTGTDYISGSNVVLAAGARFVTEVEFTVPSNAASLLNTNFRINGSVWSPNRTAPKGKLSAHNTKGEAATYLAIGSIASTWQASVPTITKNADGTYTFKGVITVTTSNSYTLKQSGSKYYAQTIIMPAQVVAPTSSGWISYQQNSYVDSATISYSGGGVSDTLMLSQGVINNFSH